jgi:hypothetical protein
MADHGHHDVEPTPLDPVRAAQGLMKASRLALEGAKTLLLDTENKDAVWIARRIEHTMARIEANLERLDAVKL